MYSFALKEISAMYDKIDSVIITNKDGVMQYSAVFDQDDNTIKNYGYTGMNILEVYPSLTEKTSSHYRVYESGKPIIDEVQILTDHVGRTLNHMSSTYPIEFNGEIVGAIEGTVYIDSEGKQLRGKEREIIIGGDADADAKRLYRLDDIIAEDPKMVAIKEKIEKVAQGPSFVLITGETGTGKELVAQAIHTHSGRRDKPFISQNCAAIPGGLLESTLFGQVKGSYTGAENKKGLFELANGGTLFLDEVNSMDMALQGKILKAIEEQKIRRIGDEKERNIDVRIVSAFNETTEEAMEGGRLRRDLYYRLGVVQIRLPSLSERKGDILPLVNYYIQRYNLVTGKNVKGCRDIVEKTLLNYPWEGNVRELRNVVEYAFNMVAGEEITLADLPDTMLYQKGETGGDRPAAGAEIYEQMLKDGASLTDVVNKFEEELIKKAASESRTVSEAAEKLGITRQALNYKLGKYKLKI